MYVYRQELALSYCPAATSSLVNSSQENIYRHISCRNKMMGEEEESIFSNRHRGCGGSETGPTWGSGKIFSSLKSGWVQAVWYMARRRCERNGERDTCRNQVFRYMVRCQVQRMKEGLYSLKTAELEFLKNLWGLGTEQE